MSPSAPVPYVITAEDRLLFTKFALVMKAIGDGTASFDGVPLKIHSGPLTIRELRAASRQAQPLPEPIPTPGPKARPRGDGKQKPRVEYEMVTGKHELDALVGVTPAGLKILQFLSTLKGQRVTLPAMVTGTGLAQSTVANALTELRKRKMVESFDVA